MPSVASLLVCHAVSWVTIPVETGSPDHHRVQAAGLEAQAVAGADCCSLRGPTRDHAGTRKRSGASAAAVTPSAVTSRGKGRPRISAELSLASVSDTWKP